MTGSWRGDSEILLSRTGHTSVNTVELELIWFWLTFELPDIWTLDHSASKPPPCLATSDVNSMVSLLVTEVKVGGEVAPQYGPISAPSESIILISELNWVESSFWYSLDAVILTHGRLLEVEWVELESDPGPVVGLQLVLDSLPGWVGGRVVGGFQPASLCPSTRAPVTTGVRCIRWIYPRRI